jgi:hypothetical protein
MLLDVTTILIPANTGINTLSLSVRVAITVTFRIS